MIVMLAMSLAAVADDTSAADERSAFNQARRDGSIEAYDAFLQQYPRGYYSEQARLNRDDAVVRAYCRAETSLDLLVDYIEINQPHAPRIRTFYANLVNQPTHSYRFTSSGLGFNGTVGEVYETVIDGKGVSTVSKFVFDNRGLLVSDSIGSTSGRAQCHTYLYNYDNLHGHYLAAIVNETDRSREEFRAEFDDLDRLVALTSSASSYRFRYNDLGALTECRVRSGASTSVVTYNDGTPIVNHISGGGVDIKQRYTYDYNAETGKRYLNAIKEVDADGEPVTVNTISYTLDAAGRYTTATVTDADGKIVRTVMRRYLQ